MAKIYKISRAEWDKLPKIEFASVSLDFSKEVGFLNFTKSGSIVVLDASGWSPESVTVRKRIVKFYDSEKLFLNEPGSALNSYVHKIGREKSQVRLN